MQVARLLHSRDTAKPFAIPISQLWDGDDGQWSTFTIRVGTPPQTFRVLPATNNDETWVPIPLGCTNASIHNPPSNCGDLRGALPFQVNPSQGFNANASSTWQPNGIFNLIMEEHLGIEANGDYGFDTVALGDNPSYPTLPHQVVAGVASSEYWLGSLGLSPKPINFTATIPSLMANLVTQNLIPSLSFGYTAGAKYNTSSSSYGSLTLGGHDRSRYIPNDVIFDFDANDSRSLTVGLQAITAFNTLNGTVSILSSPGISSLIDSGVPEIWLPKPACDIFEQAFGLKYDSTSDRYLIDPITKAHMDQINPTIHFTLAPQTSSPSSPSAISTTPQSTVTIMLPYSAFVLRGSYPLFPSSQNYFPIRRAENETQFTIGRAFLQEAYITVDYGRSKFRVSQATTPARNKQLLTAIPAAGPDPLLPNSSNTYKPTPGAIAGFVIGLLFLILLTTLTTIYLRRRRRLRQQNTHTSHNPSHARNASTTSTSTTTLKDLTSFFSPTSSHSSSTDTDPWTPQKPRLPSSATNTTNSPTELPTPFPSTLSPSELPTPLHNQELPGHPFSRELPCSNRKRPIFELPSHFAEGIPELPHGTQGQIGRKSRPRRNLVLQISPPLPQDHQTPPRNAGADWAKAATPAKPTAGDFF